MWGAPVGITYIKPVTDSVPLLLYSSGLGRFKDGGVFRPKRYADKKAIRRTVLDAPFCSNNVNQE